MLILNPGLASNLLKYRYNRLEEAKQKSIYLGFSGALFPWESAFTGVECCPSWAPEVKFLKKKKILNIWFLYFKFRELMNTIFLVIFHLLSCNFYKLQTTSHGLNPTGSHWYLVYKIKKNNKTKKIKLKKKYLDFGPVDVIKMKAITR